MPTHLLVRAKGLALCIDKEALVDDIKRFVGRKVNRDHQPGQERFISTGEAVLVPNEVFYSRKVVEGTLEACDAETAEACFGVGWSSKWKPEVEPAPASKKGNV